MYKTSKNPLYASNHNKYKETGMYRMIVDDNHSFMEIKRGKKNKESSTAVHSQDVGEIAADLLKIIHQNAVQKRKKCRPFRGW